MKENALSGSWKGRVLIALADVISTGLSGVWLRLFAIHGEGNSQPKASRESRAADRHRRRFDLTLTSRRTAILK